VAILQLQESFDEASDGSDADPTYKFAGKRIAASVDLKEDEM